MSIFPFDVWCAIASRLSIRDICTLQATCKTMDWLLGERPIWYAALRDVLTVKPLPYVQRDMPSMTSADMRAACVSLTRMDCALAQTEIVPKLEVDIEGHDYSVVYLMPGGTRYIAASAVGTLRLCRGPDVLDEIPSPCSAPSDSQYRMLTISTQAVLFLHAVNYNGDGTPTVNIEFRLYHVKENFRLLGTVRPEDCMNTVYYALNETAHGPALVYLQGCSGKELLACICLIDSTTGVLTPTAALRLRSWVVPSYMHGFVLLYGSVAFFGSDRVLLTTSSGIYLYKIPPLDSLVNKSHRAESPEPVDVSPIWSTHGAWATSTPLLSPPTVYGSAKARARCVVWTGHDMHILDVPLHGGPGDFMRCSTTRIDARYTHQTLQAVAHGLGLQRHRSKDTPSTVVAFTVGDGDGRGYVRLGHTPSVVRQVGVKWEASSCLVYMSLDDLSGRVAVLECGQEGGSSSRRLKIYSILR